MVKVSIFFSFILFSVVGFSQNKVVENTNSTAKVKVVKKEVVPIIGSTKETNSKITTTKTIPNIQTKYGVAVKVKRPNPKPFDPGLTIDPNQTQDPN